MCIFFFCLVVFYFFIHYKHFFKYFTVYNYDSSYKVLVWYFQNLYYLRVDFCWLPFYLKWVTFSFFSIYICWLIWDCILGIVNIMLLRAQILLHSFNGCGCFQFCFRRQLTWLVSNCSLCLVCSLWLHKLQFSYFSLSWKMILVCPCMCGSRFS